MTARFFSNGGIISCSQPCRSLGPSRMATELNFVAAWGTGRAAPMWILSHIGWSGHIEKRLPAEYLSLFLMLPEGSTPVFLTIFSSSRTHFGAHKLPAYEPTRSQVRALECLVFVCC